MNPIAHKPDSRRAAAEQSKFRILEAAEHVFASEGYSSTSMRAIAEHAEVTTGLLHYHFESKQKLYAAIVSWRAEAINNKRLLLLKALPEPADVPDILRALFKPALGVDAGGVAFARIMARMMSADSMHQELVRTHYDATAKVFIAALQKTTGLSWEDAAWGYDLAIHVLISGMARSGRTERLVGQTAPASADDYLNRLIAFATGGIRHSVTTGGVADQKKPTGEPK